jgi:hypothetical protein
MAPMAFGTPYELLELRERLLDRIQVVTVGTQEQQADIASINSLTYACHFVAGKIVGNDDVADRLGLIAPSCTVGATTQSIRSPATAAVLVRQCPCGIATNRRLP